MASPAIPARSSVAGTVMLAGPSGRDGDPNQIAGFDPIYAFGAYDRIRIHPITGSPVNMSALAEAFERGDRTNGDIFLGDNGGDVVGSPYVSASNMSVI